MKTYTSSKVFGKAESCSTMMARSSTWSVILFLSILFTIASSQQECGGTIEAGAGVIRSPSYPDTYPASDCQWIIHSGDETRIRIKFIVLNCSGDSLRVYDGSGIAGVPLLGQFCDMDPPEFIDSSGRFITINFASSGESENTQGFVISYESIDDALGSRVIYSEFHPVLDVVRITSVLADPIEMLKTDSVETISYYASRVGNWTGLATHYGQHEIIWSDSQQKAVFKGSMGSDRTGHAYYTFTSSNVVGVAVDWLTGNVYWTDATYDWIIMFNSNGTRHALIIDEDLDIPTGIAIHPSRGYLFWTDSGSRPKVERSNLAGGSRIELVTTSIICPTGITIDFDTELLYWVDAYPSYNRMEVSNLDGTHRRMLMHSRNDLGLFDLTISGDFIYTTAKKTQNIIVLWKSNGTELFAVYIDFIPYSIVTYAPDVQPQEYSPCSSNPCSYLCVGGGPNGYTCLCEHNFHLKADGHTCEEEGSIVDPPQFLVASQTKICSYPENFPDLSFSPLSSEEKDDHCFYKGLLHAVAIAVDVEDGVVFYSDVNLKAIGMVTLRDGAPVKLVTGGVRNVHGLAVDWMTKNLYWTDYSKGSIEVSKYDGSYRTALIKDNVNNPRSIAIDPERDFLFWTEFGSPPQIERAFLDGTGRAIILRAPYGLRLLLPTGLAVDTKEERLYYTDLISTTINKIDYFGNNKTELLRKRNTYFFDVALYKDYILWTEMEQGNGIYAANRHTGQQVMAYRPGGEQVYGITTYADIPQKTMQHPCRYENGGCEQLCLSSASNQRGFICVCTLGFFLAQDGRSCVSDLVQDNFFLVTDTYRRAIFQVDLLQSSFRPKALYLPRIQNPVSVTFDPVERKVYWSDIATKSISRASLNGDNYQVIARNGVEHPDAIALDSISRLLYWTDSVAQTLTVSHLNGYDRKILIEGLSEPRAIVLHPVEGTMFWTSLGDNPVIERAYMDGTQRGVIVSGSLRWPNGLTIDYNGNRLYWSDAGLDRLETADFNGNGRRVVLSFGRDLHAYDVAVLGQFLYWTDWLLQSVLKVDKDTGRGNVTIGPNDYARPNGIFMVSNSTLPQGDHPCSSGNGGCDGLCLPAGHSRTCTCADGFRFDLDGATCVEDQVTECPRNFSNGMVDESCDLPRPWHICNTQCLPGFDLSIDAISCETSGRWDVDDNAICTARQCHPLKKPPHAAAGPCSPPYTTGKMCKHFCPAGYTRTGGSTVRLCDKRGEWTGTPIRCEPSSESGNTNPCDPDLVFIEEPQDSQRAEGDSFTMRCRVTDENVAIKWFKDEQRLDIGYSDGILVDQFDQLSIFDFDFIHEGHYECVASAGNTECIRADAYIALNRLAVFSHVPEDAHVDIENEDRHVFLCSPKDGTWGISWLKDDKPLENPDLMNGSLVLSEIREEDEGKYTCVASDPRSRSSGQADAWLFLSDPPQIDIAEVCGTAMIWPDDIRPTQPPQILSSTEDGDDESDRSVSEWKSFDSSFDDGFEGIVSDNDAEGMSARIVGGYQAEKGVAPFMVLIQEMKDKTWKTMCGGTLLDQKWVMTAAHCVSVEFTRNPAQKERLKLVFGEYDTLTEEDSEIERRPAEIIVHEEYNKKTFDNDIALIRIEPPLRKFTSYIRPICLPPAKLSSLLMKRGNVGRVTGWGQNSFEDKGNTNRFLKAVKLPIQSRQTCRNSGPYNEEIFTDRMFCAGFYDENKDACSGDSGGPLAVFHHDDGRWYQVGIVSWGIECAKRGKYGFYAHVTSFLHWLRSKNVTVAYSPNVALRFNISEGSDKVLAFTARSPSNITVAVGNPVDLECVPNIVEASVEWFIGPHPVSGLVLAESVRISPTGLAFHFDAISRDYAGAYSCEARLDDGEGEQVIRADFQIHVTPA